MNQNKSRLNHLNNGVRAGLAVLAALACCTTVSFHALAQGAGSPPNVIFSVDAGSDAELSDPLVSGALECLDPGDGYSSLSAATCAPDGMIDDRSFFFPEPPPNNIIATSYHHDALMSMLWDH